ncbi:MAG TPA: energy transducer TonB [Candidatus Sulfotelmatobacter sp.]|nr:energy transducer TonB [Candidatus Sulfotelmatobacter sp.]
MTLEEHKTANTEFHSLVPIALTIVLIALLAALFAGSISAQELSRKTLVRTAPSYPELARKLHLEGKVKLEILIDRAGVVRTAKMLGGNPVFEQSAIETVKQWRFEPADKETKAVILLDFTDR